MQIFPEITAAQFGEVEPGPLIPLKVAAQRHAWCLKAVRDPSGDAPQEFVVALARSRFEVLTAPLSRPARTVSASSASMPSAPIRRRQR